MTDNQDKKGQAAEKRPTLKVSYGLKRKILDEVLNGQVSKNYASRKYGVTRSAIDYWIKKYSTLEARTKNVNQKDELKKLKERIEELEFIKDYQQDIIAEFEIETGKLLSKKYLPEHLAKEIEQKRKKHR